MNSKSIFKRILPILIALIVILVVAIVGSIVSKDKRVPSFDEKAYGNEAFITYTTADGTEIKLSRNEIYNALRGTSSSESVITDTTVNELLNMVDADLLAEYVSNVKENEVFELIAKQIFSSTLDSYIKSNEDAFKVAAHKEGKAYRTYLNEQIDEKIEEFVKTLKYSYGFEGAASEFTYKDASNDYYYVQEDGADKLDDDGNKIYQLKVDKNSQVYAYYALEQARTDYAKKIIKDEYEEDFKAYLQYLDDLEAYNNYLEAVADYEEALEDWKNTKSGSKPKKSDYYTEKVSEPEVVAEPLNGALDEDAIKKLYEEDNFVKFWAIITSFSSQAAAENALIQYGVVIAENASGDNRWFHYGVTDFATASLEDKALIAAYNFTTKGETTIIIDDDYYNLLTTDQELYDKDVAKTSTEKTGLVLATKENPDPRTGAYELTEAEVKDIIVKIYNQNNQSDASKQITNADYDPSATDATYDEDSKFYYTESELTSMGLYAKGTSSNKFYKFSDSSTFDNAEIYTNTILSSNSKYYLYLILDKDADVDDWDDYLDGKKYYETQIYLDNKEELLEAQATATYTKTAVAKLRLANNIKFYDEILEANYMENYKSDYKANKKSSKTVLVSYEVNGSKKEITVDTLWAKLAPYYGVYATVDLLQYEWVFLEACDADGKLFNQYVDYNKYLSGKKLSKCILDNDKAKKMYENVSNYVDNVKYYFSVGYYESYGYPSSYGWKNFITDYYATYYNVRLTTNDDLKLFFINQQIIAEYSNYISKVNAENWESAYLTYAGKTLSKYINTTGIHLLISLPDVEKNEKNNSSSNFLDPTRWSSDQLAAAEELYDSILDLLAQVDEDEISTVLNGIVSAFDNALLPLVDGTTPNVRYTKETLSGSEVTDYLFDYQYEYYQDGALTPLATIDVSKYKAMGFKLTCEDLTVTAGTMVSEFEDAVRQIWNSQLDKLVVDGSNNDVVIYDHSFTAPKYENYDEDTDTESVLNDNGTNTYLATTFGLHVYVNLSSDLSAYFTTNTDGDKVFIEIPDIKFAQMYVYDKNEVAEEDYVALATLYSDYETAKEDNDEKRLADLKTKIEAANEKLGFGLSFDEFYALLEEYAGDNANYVSTQLSTYFTAYSSSSQTSNATYSMVFGDYVSSTYYHLTYMNDLLAKVNASKVDLADGNEYEALLESYVSYFIDSYYKSFASINFINGNADGLEELLDALACVKDVSAYDTVASSAMTALKDFATNAYNALSAEEQADLETKAIAAGIGVGKK